MTKIQNNRNLDRFECRLKVLKNTSKSNYENNKKFYDTYSKKKEKVMFDEDKTLMDKYNFVLSKKLQNNQNDYNNYGNYISMYSKCDKITNK